MKEIIHEKIKLIDHKFFKINLMKKRNYATLENSREKVADPISGANYNKWNHFLVVMVVFVFGLLSFSSCSQSPDATSGDRDSLSQVNQPVKVNLNSTEWQPTRVSLKEGEQVALNADDLPRKLVVELDDIGPFTAGTFSSDIPNFSSTVNIASIPKSVRPGNYQLTYTVQSDPGKTMEKGQSFHIPVLIR